MAKKKSRQTYLKRQRELQRMEKAELKRQKRLGRRSGELPYESSSQHNVANPDLESGGPLLVEIPEAGSSESIDVDALRASLGLSPLKKPTEPAGEPTGSDAPTESSES